MNAGEFRCTKAGNGGRESTGNTDKTLGSSVLPVFSRAHCSSWSIALAASLPTPAIGGPNVSQPNVSQRNRLVRQPAMNLVLCATPFGITDRFSLDVSPEDARIRFTSPVPFGSFVPPWLGAKNKRTSRRPARSTRSPRCHWLDHDDSGRGEIT